MKINIAKPLNWYVAILNIHAHFIRRVLCRIRYQLDLSGLQKQLSTN